MENKPFGDLGTAQEHGLIGGSERELYKNTPYTPICVITGRLTAEECNKKRLETKSIRGILTTEAYGVGTYWEGEVTLEPIDTNPNSGHYGKTKRDPILVGVFDFVSEADVKDFPFPFARDGPVIHLEDNEDAS